ncbi:DUF1836 domain-containing protein [Peptostreptococcus faecalis]|uniref:DUF1836 domain-containing protein n=1 Tax=Peptostreptococcus faecalis TaxID=2045015 RepID=UPI001A9A6A63|nr:DUF1836 domain-containing protein [Peptostreptococcus faecalis]
MYDLKRVIDELMEKDDIKTDDIPNIDIYMDQILSLFDKYFPYNDDEQRLTKTMVNNYAKGNIIKPPSKKKYNKEHILTIVIICILKRNMSLSDIKKVFDKISEIDVEDNINGSEVEAVYDSYLIKKAEMNNKISSKIDFILSELKNDDISISEKKLLDVLILSYYSNLLGEAARTIIREEE